MSVVCPTATPGTSVIEFNGPTGRMPILRPMSRARGLEGFAVWEKVGEMKTESNKTTAILFITIWLNFGKGQTRLSLILSASVFIRNSAVFV